MGKQTSPFFFNERSHNPMRILACVGFFRLKRSAPGSDTLCSTSLADNTLAVKAGPTAVLGVSLL